MENRSLSGARTLVTGGAGFLGSWLCERLLDDGADVVCLDSLITGSVGNVAHLRGRAGFRFVEADVTDGVPPVGPVDVVFHLASPASPVHYQRHPLETLRVGSRGTEHALDVAHQHHARFVLASTSEVYGDPEEHPQRESYRGRVDPVGPRSMYDEAKRFAEALVSTHRRHCRTDTGIARIFNTYGPRMGRDDGRLIPTLVGQAIAGEPLTVFGDGSQTRSLCWVEDTVDGLVRLALSGEPGPINIGSDDERSVAEIAKVVLEVTGSSAAIHHEALPEHDPLVRRPDLTRARELLGWAPSTPLDVGLPRTVEWFLSTADEQDVMRSGRQDDQIA